jgi:hypothetical protein
VSQTEISILALTKYTLCGSVIHYEGEKGAERLVRSHSG